MKRFIWKILFVNCIYFGCTLSKKNIVKNSESNSSTDTSVTISQVIASQNEKIKFDKDLYLNKHLDTLRLDLQKKQVSSFVYNECIDNHNASYYYVNSHTKQSLRFELIQKLSKDEITKLMNIADSTLLKKKCPVKIESMPYSDTSTWELLKKSRKN